MKKKLFLLITVLCFVLAFSAGALAKDNVAQIGETSYATLQEAIDDCSGGETVTLLQDCNEVVYVDCLFDAPVTIVTDGYFMPTSAIQAVAPVNCIRKDNGDYILTTVYAVHFETNGGSFIDDVYVDCGFEMILGDFVPEKAGYTFRGWFSDKELTARVFAPVISGETTFYAGWLKDLEPVDPGCPGDETCPAYCFTDLDLHLWYHEPIDFCLVNGILRGMSDTQFGPGLVTTRGMFVTALYRIFNEYEVRGHSEFDDVAAGVYYEKPVIWAADLGLVQGYNKYTFGPEDPVTREQMIQILYNVAQKYGFVAPVEADLTVFADDADISAWAQEAMNWAVANQIVLGNEDGYLNPQGKTTRAEFAALIMRGINYVYASNDATIVVPAAIRVRVTPGVAAVNGAAQSFFKLDVR